MLQSTAPEDLISTLRFHPVASGDLQLSNNNTTVKKITPGTSSVFSSHALGPYQKFTLKLSEIADTKEIITVGFTPRPTLDHEDLFSLKIVSLRKHKTILKKKVHFFYTPTGRVHFGVEGEEKGYRDGKVPIQGPLWAFIRISNPGTTVEVVNCSSFDWSTVGLLTPIGLHPTKGRNVKLVKNTIQKYDTRLNVSYAFSRSPVRLGEHVIVKILDVNFRSNGNLTLGLTSTDPSTLEKDLPDDVTSLASRPGFSLITDPSWGFKLHDEISFVILSNGNIKIWRNDCTLLKEVRVDVSLDLWVFFDVKDIRSVEVSAYTSPLLQKFKALAVKKEWNEVKNTAFLERQVSGGSDDDGDTCVVCCDRLIEAALYPCGHMCMCYGCAKQQWKDTADGVCPICRVKIRDVMKIYKV